MATLEFRRDIEGLRALAVFGVVVFHVAPLQLPGGYVGVDVFFVISGFLMTSIIKSRIESGTFSFLQFYARRIRRLFPALIAMIFAVLFLSYFFMLPHEVESLAKSAASSGLYVSNLYFMLISDYFNSSLTRDPMLHTWSLSVEEQYYLFFPVFMVLVFFRSRFFVIASFVVVGFISFLFAQLVIDINDAFAFFLMPTRLWQFFLGGILAFIPGLALARWLREAGVALGVVAIILSFFLLSEGTPMPGAAAFPVTIGTTIIILAGMSGQSTVGRLIFENHAARFVGRISYSVYLWHWPIVVFYELNIVHTNIFEKFALLLASFAVGTLSWWLFERPFSRSAVGKTGKIVALGGLASLAVVGVSFLILTTRGFEWRFSPEQIAMARPEIDQSADTADQPDCFLKTSQMKSIELFDFDRCVDNSSADGKVLLIGDSHMNSLAPGFRGVLSETSLSQVGASRCRPLVFSRGDPTCLEIMNFVIESLIPSGGFETVIIAGRWKPSDLEEIQKNLGKITGFVQQVIIVGPIVEYKQSLPRLLAFNFLGDSAGVDKWSRIKEKRALDSTMKQALANVDGVRYISIIDAMCDDMLCTYLSEDGKPIQKDYGHLSKTGAVEVVRKFETMGYLEDL